MNIVVCNTKGGPGKTVTACHILPLLSGKPADQIRIYEIDNANNSEGILKNSDIKIKSFSTEDTDAVLSKALYAEALSKSELLNIFDVGAGLESLRATLVAMSETEEMNPMFVIPTNEDPDQMENIKSTLKLIRSVYPKAKVMIALNKATGMDKDEMQDQFVFFFGSDKLKIDGIYNEIQKDIAHVFSFPHSPMVALAKGYYKQSFCDIYHGYLDTKANYATLKEEWVKSGEEGFEKSMKIYQQGKRIAKLRENASETIEKIFGKGA